MRRRDSIIGLVLLLLYVAGLGFMMHVTSQRPQKACCLKASCGDLQ